MHIWTITKWNARYDKYNTRAGLRLRCDKDVDVEVKKACKDFCRWLRSEYYFPIRVPIYLKSSYRIHSIDGEYVYGTFFEPYDKLVEPYVRIATGDFHMLLEKWGYDNAINTILQCIAHELTHYFQWINDLKLTEIGRERQASQYSRFIIDEYLEVRRYSSIIYESD